MQTALLMAKGVTKTFKSGNEEITVLDNMDFTVHSGEMVAIIGESGTGKTTLLQVLGGLSSPDKGSLTLNSIPIIMAGRSTGFKAMAAIGTVSPCSSAICRIPSW